LIERSFQELFGTVETIKIIEELIEIGPNKVCNKNKFRLGKSKIGKDTRVQKLFIIIRVAI